MWLFKFYIILVSGVSHQDKLRQRTDGVFIGVRVRNEYLMVEAQTCDPKTWEGCHRLRPDWAT